MPCKNLILVPSLLEPVTIDHLNKTSKEHSLSRAALMRIMMKYCLQPSVLKTALAYGDIALTPISPTKSLKSKPSPAKSKETTKAKPTKAKPRTKSPTK